MARRSVMAHQFSQVPRADIQRSKFNRSHGYKTTFNSGYLVPIYVDEALPGDTIKLRNTIFARLSTPIVPIMDNLFLETFYFAVPVRLIWDNWQRFNGEQTDPGDSTDYLVPQVPAPSGGYAYESLGDYFGLPTGKNITTSAFWHRAYNLIWNEWFRDENLQDSLPVPRDDGPDDPADYNLQRRGKRHDYFTSALPWPQKGPGVEIGLAGEAPISGTTPIDAYSLSIPHDSSFNGSSHSWKTSSFTGIFGSNVTGTTNGKSGALVPSASATKTGSVDVPFTGTADLSLTSAATINSLRQAFQIQRLLERDARGGTRYTEILRSHFGVVSPDARLQRPEYLGGSSQPIKIMPVPQTSATDAKTPQGNLAAFGLVGDGSGGFSKSFVEHCVIIGLANVRADLTYQQGINRMWSRRTRWDFYWPALAHLGEQAILNKEIYAQGTSEDEDVFGYQERWAEYRYKPSQITGKFRSSDPQSLDVWHLSQQFGNLPVLNDEFIQDKPPLSRVLAVQDEPQILFDSYISLSCARPMPVYSVPGLIDHF